jgi:NitT/TauT family transport system substrate-binding protein
MSYAPIFIAEAEGYFEEFGIQVEMVPFDSTSEAIPLVISGELDAYAGAVNAGLLNTLHNDQNIRVVANRGRVEADMDCTFQGILVRKDLFESGDVTGPADLAGRIVVVTAAGPATFMVSEYLAQAGLTMEDVDRNDMPSSAYIDAMANGSVDVIATLELNLGRILAAGDSVLLAGAEDIVGDFQTSILAFGKNLLTDNPDLGVRFMAAYLKGIAQYNEGKTDRNLEILSEATGEDVEALRNSCWLPISEDGVPEFENVVPFMNWSVEQGHLDQTITEEQFWTSDFLEQAKLLLEE